jgi:raffinose/stachyose/melibiose transport system substrate-binding protein
MKKTWICIVTAVLLMCGLAACSGKDSPGGTCVADAGTKAQTGGAGTQAETDAAVSGEKVKLRGVYLNGDEVQNDIMDNYIKKNLAEEFPNVEIEWEGTGDLTNLLKTYSATGDLPDVWYSDAASATAIINAGNQLNLVDYITKDGFIDNYVNPDALYYSDGGIYAISSGIDAFYTPAVYYNKEIFKQYNLEVPQTYDELIGVCQTLIDNGITPISITGTTGWSVRNFLFFTILMNEDPAAAQALLSNEIDFTDERVVGALKKIEDMLNMGCFPEGAANIDFSTHCALYTEGKTAMIATMSWSYGELEAAQDTGVFMWPSSNPEVKTGQAIQIWGSALNGWAVNAKSEHLDLAVQIAEYCTKQEALRHAEKGSSLNFKTDNAAQITSELEKERMEMYDNAELYLKPLHLNAMDSAVMAEFSTYTNLLLAGDYTAQQFSEDFNPIWKANTWFQKQ